MTDVKAKLDAIVAMVEQAKTKPLSGTVVIARADLLNALNDARESLPGEIAEAQKVLRERRSLTEAGRAEADKLVSDARRQSERMVEEARRNSERMLSSARQERAALIDEASVLAEAEDDAEQVVADARGEALRMRAETDDYVDASLARFEALLEHTLATVGRGRDKLRQMSDAALQQEFPDPDGQVGMPAAPQPGLGSALPVPDGDLTDGLDDSPAGAVQPALLDDESGADPADDAALAR